MGLSFREMILEEGLPAREGMDKMVEKGKISGTSNVDSFIYL